jgi:hypothetical protein
VGALSVHPTGYDRSSITSSCCSLQGICTDMRTIDEKSLIRKVPPRRAIGLYTKNGGYRPDHSDRWKLCRIPSGHLPGNIHLSLSRYCESIVRASERDSTRPCLHLFTLSYESGTSCKPFVPLVIAHILHLTICHLTIFCFMVLTARMLHHGLACYLFCIVLCCTTGRSGKWGAGRLSIPGNRQRVRHLLLTSENPTRPLVDKRGI